MDSNYEKLVADIRFKKRMDDARRQRRRDNVRMFAIGLPILWAIYIGGFALFFGFCFVMAWLVATIGWGFVFWGVLGTLFLIGISWEKAGGPAGWQKLKVWWRDAWFRAPSRQPGMGRTPYEP